MQPCFWPNSGLAESMGLNNASLIKVDAVRVEYGRVAEYWDVLQDDGTPSNASRSCVLHYCDSCRRQPLP